MARVREEPEIEIEEYEEIVGHWGQASVREGATDNRALSIQEPTSNEQFDFMTHQAIGPETNRRELRQRRKRVVYGGRQITASEFSCSASRVTIKGKANVSRPEGT